MVAKFKVVFDFNHHWNTFKLPFGLPGKIMVLNVINLFLKYHQQLHIYTHSLDQSETHWLWGNSISIYKMHIHTYMHINSYCTQTSLKYSIKTFTSASALCLMLLILACWCPRLILLKTAENINVYKFTMFKQYESSINLQAYHHTQRKTILIIECFQSRA